MLVDMTQLLCGARNIVRSVLSLSTDDVYGAWQELMDGACVSAHHPVIMACADLTVPNGRKDVYDYTVEEGSA